MGEEQSRNDKKGAPRRLILPSLFISSFANQPPGILTSLLLIDIGVTFGCSVGVAGQIRTLSPIISVVFGLFMGALSIRFRHKSLLLIGLLLLTVSALFCAFAPDFNVMLVSYSLNGLGFAMVSPMTLTLIGEYFTLERRASSIGWVNAGGSIAYLVGAPVIGFIAGLGGWRWAFLGFVLPVSIMSFLLAAKGLPSTSPNPQHSVNIGSYLKGFRGVLANRSADACLIGNALSTAAWFAILLYSSSFLRQRFSVSMGFASLFIFVAALCYTLGSLISGRLVKKVGRKPLTVMAALGAGVFIVLYTSLPNLWLSLATSILGCFLAGMRLTASHSLTLEQVPEFRGTMMSLNSAAASSGSAIGAGVGGLILLMLGYEGMALSLGAMSIVAAIFFYIFSIDPIRV